MPGAEVETAHAAYEAFSRGDGSFFEFLDAEVEWHPAAHFIEGPVHGHDELRRLLDSFRQAFEELRWEPLRIEQGTEAGEVVAVVDVVTKGRGSGAEGRVRVAHLLRFRDGKLIWGKVYPNAAEGLTAAGVDPSA